ncbi:Transcription factor vib-1 [Hirsutella minnesotensis 3608]|nr:Transcription factor vib-1 [Hirsutella minnesotensis 3608]
MDHQAYSYRGYSQDDPAPYERHPSYSSLKRSFSQAESPAYQEIVQDLREDSSRLTVNQDHKLLAFRRAQDKTTTVDQHGRVQQLELSAQLHGMFFLSEMPSSASDGSVIQPELTCYRRNLFQISGSLVMPRGQLSVVNESNETVPVSNMEVSISAIESVDGNPVRLIVIPWKTPPPNSTDINQAPDQEPPTLPLIPFQDDGADAEGELAVYPVGWRRLQFRIATANNGRRKELQQHFVLHLKVFGTLADGSKVVLTESTTAPIVVRGRSPRNFQTRKEIPLLGSSAGSRGQALVETGLGVVASALSMRQDSKSRSMDMQVPRSSFTFSPPKPHGSTLSSLRSNSYPSWNSQVPAPSAGAYPPTSIGADSYPKLPLSGAPGFTTEPQEMPLQTSMAPSVPLPLPAHEQPPTSLRSHYSYTSSAPQLPGTTVTLGGTESAFSMPRYVDSNPRPSKSPRQSGHQSVHSSGSISNTDTSSDYRYGSYRAANSGTSDASQQQSYPPPSSWTSTSSEQNSTLAYAGSDGRPYSFSHEPYKSGASVIPPLKHDPATSSVYGGGSRSSFDSMNNYSWSAA